MTISDEALAGLVTVAMIPRDTFVMSNQVLDRLVETTPPGVAVIVADTGASPGPRAHMEQVCKKHGYALLRSRSMATPNQARNAVIDMVTTKYVAFVDNDTLVTEGWLQPLVQCAEETGAWAVGPTICERMPEATWLHGYDGELEIRQTPDGRRYYHDLHYNAHVKLDSIRHQLKRMETPIVEFHAMLVAMEAYKALGKYNENIVNMYEYGDFLLRVQAQGKKIMLEPNSLVTYVPPRGVPSEDREFFELRWCEAWTELTYRSMAEQHGLTLDHPEWKLPHNFVRSQRMFGKNWLRKPRRWLGRNKLRWLERMLLVPIDVWINRIKYPARQYGRIKPAEFVRVT
jgi:glycosyltransferase involved in cell wall biosynthesis